MPNLPANPAITSTAGDIIKDALMELGVISPGEEIPEGEAAFCLRKLNRILDTFNARSVMIFSVNFKNYTIIPNHQPHTIGPGGDFDVDSRPVKIEAANLIFTNSIPSVNLPLGIRDDQWWANQRVQGLTSTVPTDLYYSPDFPRGNIYLWPVPTVAYGLQLELWSSFILLTKLDDQFIYPPGYWDAVVYMLALTLAPAFQVNPSPVLAAAYTKAISTVQGLNSEPPRIDLRSPGMPGSGKGRHWDWRTGGYDSGS